MEESRKRKHDETPSEAANENQRTEERAIIERAKNQAGVKKHLVLMYSLTDDAFTIIDSAVNHARMRLTVKNVGRAEGMMCPKYQLKINDEIFAEGEYPSEPAARHMLGRSAFHALQRHCISILRKTRFTDRNMVTPEFSSTSIPPRSTLPQTTAACAKGAKMMEKMGWTGGGLGAHEQGRLDIIESCEQISRLGLGNSNITGRLKQMLGDLAAAKSLTNLAFVQFSKEERAQIHGIAHRNHLTTRSYGKGEDRYIVVQCKMTRWDIVERLHEEGGENEQYKLIYPTDPAM